jgi:hypothetical protein
MKRMKRNDVASGNRDEDVSGENDGGRVEGKSNNVENTVGNNTAMIVPHQPVSSLPSSSPGEMLQFAGMAGLNNMLPAGLNNNASVAQPNFMMNAMLPAALLGNANAALINGVNPLNFAAGMSGFPGVPTMPNFSIDGTQQGLQQHGNIPGMVASAIGEPSPVPAPSVATFNEPATALQQSGSSIDSTSLTNALSGMDSATLAKLQEIVAAGGAETLLQHLQQQGQMGGTGLTVNNNGSNPDVNNVTIEEKVPNVHVKHENDSNVDEDRGDDDDSEQGGEDDTGGDDDEENDVSSDDEMSAV